MFIFQFLWPINMRSADCATIYDKNNSETTEKLRGSW